MTIQQIRCFLTVARTLNYTQAAQEMFISQSAVSKQIQTLEQEFRIQLFRRDHHSVVLTPAGSFLADQFGTIWKFMGDAVEQARAIDAQDKVLFRLGVLPYLDMNRIAPRLFDDFAQVCPGCRLTVEVYSLNELLDAFYQEQVDAILIRTFDMVKGRSVVRFPISRGKTCIYFSRKLFPDRQDLSDLHLKDFTGATVFLQSQKRHNEPYHSHVFYKHYGFLPGEVQYVPAWDTILSQVHLGYGITLAGPSFRITREDDLISISACGDRSNCGVDAVWLSDGKNPNLSAFQHLICHMDLPSCNNT